MRCIETVKIMEILRLGELGLSQRDIAASANCGKSTVSEVQQRCREKGLTYDTAAGMSAKALVALLYPPKGKASNKTHPNWDEVHTWIKGGKRRNLQFAWENFRREHPDGIGYTQFCKHYGEWQEKTGRKVTMAQNHEPGKELYVDWAGDTLDCVKDPSTGELLTAHFFVAALGYSCYPYCEAFADEKMDNWLTAHIHTFEYINGLPALAVPDNCATAITRANYYDPVINASYLDMARHYNVAIVPARVKKARDKSVVEGSVGWLETWLLEWLRGQIFYSFEELNRAIAVRVKELAERPFQKRAGSRASEFEAIDRPALRPLPPTRYEFAEFIVRRVPDNYHVEYKDFYYSAPYTLYKQEVVLRATSTIIEIIDRNGGRAALHQRRFSGSRYVSAREHMPEKHRRQLDSSARTGRDYLKWAAAIGANTHAVIENILSSQEVEESTYRSCMGVLQLAKKHGPKQLEYICGYALGLGSTGYTAISRFMKNPPPVKGLAKPLPAHENLRDPAEFA
jgi:transposase